jgi:hypothetical protein
VRKIEAYVPAVIGLDVEDEDSGLTIEQTTPEVVEFWPDYSEFAELILGVLPVSQAGTRSSSKPLQGPTDEGSARGHGSLR